MITYKLDEAEFLEGMAALFLWPRKLIIANVIFLSMLLAVGAYLEFSSGPKTAPTSIGILFVCLAVPLVLASLIVRPFALRRKYRRNYNRIMASRPPTTISWSEAGFSDVAGQNEVAPWSTFNGWKQTQRLVLLYARASRGTQMLIIPKRAFTSTFQLDDFVNVVGRKIDAQQGIQADR